MAKRTREEREPVTSLWRASVETRNFDFEAFGLDADEAVEVLRRTWEDHKSRNDAELDWVEDLLCDVLIQRVRAGRGYIDGEAAGGPKPLTNEDDRRLWLAHLADR